ncbi:unnamed protein product [Diamesa serratosioi]
MKIDHRIIGIIFDLNCNETEDVFKEISLGGYFNASYNWLMIAEDYDKSVELLKQQNINLDAEITLIVPENSSNSFMLFDIYNPCHKNGGVLNVTEKGYYNKNKGFNITLTQHKIYRRSNLNGITFEAGVVATEIPKHQTLLEYMESDDNIQFDAQHRLSYRLFKLLSIQHNFSMNLHRSELWGLYRNGTFNGVLGMIQQGQIDLSITPFRYTNERLDVLDFSVVTWVTTDLQVGIEDISYNLDFFQLTTNKVELEFFHKKVVKTGKPLKENFFNVLDGVEKLKKGGFAFHVDVSYAYRTINELLSESEICELHEMLLFPIRPLAVGLPKGSPLKELITVGLQRLIEAGMLDYYSRRWYSSKPKCVESKTLIKAVDLTQASSIFIAIFIGILFSLFVLVIEILNYKIKETLKMRRNVNKSLKKLLK